MKNSLLQASYNENVIKQSKIFTENVDKQSQNTHAEHLCQAKVKGSK